MEEESVPFGNVSPMPTMVYEYRAYAPTDGCDAVDAVMRGRTRLWNELVRIDRDCRDAQRELTGQRRWADAVKEQPEIEPRLHLLDIQRRNRVNAACAASGLYWVDSDDVKASYQQAIATHKHLFDWWRDRETKEWRCGDRWDLRFRPVDGSGKAALRVSKAPRLFETHDVHRAAGYTPEVEATLHVGKQHVTVTFRVRMHRPLPADATVVRVELGRKLVGYHDRWSLRYTLRTATAQAPLREIRRRAEVHFHWTVRGGSLLVATWTGDDGRAGDVLLPEKITRAFKHINDLASIRKDHFNHARQFLSDVRAESPGFFPDWLLHRTGTIEQWKSPYRMTRAMDDWYGEQLIDSDAAGLLQDYARRDHHLADEQENLRRRTLAHRDWLYGNFAAQLCRDYDEITLHTLDLKALARQRDLPEDARENRQRVAISDLVTRIEQTAKREGVHVLKRKAGGVVEQAAEAEDSAAETEPVALGR